MIIKSDSAEESGVLVAERTQYSLIMIRSRKAHEDKEDMGLAVQSRHFRVVILNLKFSLPMQRKIPPLPHVQVCLQSQHAQE